MELFTPGVVVAYPTDTSYGLGVRYDDALGLERLFLLKQRPHTAVVSLMVTGWEALQHWALLPEGLTEAWFFTTPRTAILSPSAALRPLSPLWSQHEKVGFRLCSLPEVAATLPGVPITTTSANRSGQQSLFTPEDIQRTFAEGVVLHPHAPVLEGTVQSSEIWDLTVSPPVRLR